MPSGLTLAFWMVTPETAVRSGVVAPLVSWVMARSMAELALWGSCVVSCRFWMRSLLTTMRLRPPAAVLTA